MEWTERSQLVLVHFPLSLSKIYKPNSCAKAALMKERESSPGLMNDALCCIHSDRTHYALYYRFAPSHCYPINHKSRKYFSGIEADHPGENSVPTRYRARQFQRNRLCVRVCSKCFSKFSVSHSIQRRVEWWQMNWEGMKRPWPNSDTIPASA
jgi:hypothetical protein